MKLGKMKTLANKKGFTLIELMIVIAIIGILAAVAIPNYISFRDKGYCSGAESDANAILGNLADYYAIPAHTSYLAATIPPEGGSKQGIYFSPLSNGNTATVSTSSIAVGATTKVIYIVTVTDNSTRCPIDYRQSQVDAGWSSLAAGGVFRKSM